MSARHRKETATYWAHSVSDGFGGYVFAAPVLIKVRWEVKRELFINENNEEETSSSLVYMDHPMEVGDYVALGDHINLVTGTVLDPTTLGAVSWRIKMHDRVSDIRNLSSITKAFL